MATKKQKREAAQARREEFLAEEKAAGLAALVSSKAHEEKVRSLLTARSKALSDRTEASLRAEITSRARAFGTRVRVWEEAERHEDWARSKGEWREFLRGLKDSPHHDAAVDAYVDAYEGKASE